MTVLQHTSPTHAAVVNADVGKVTVATGSISILADMLAGRLTLFRHVCCITNATAVHSAHFFYLFIFGLFA